MPMFLFPQFRTPLNGEHQRENINLGHLHEVLHDAVASAPVMVRVMPLPAAYSADGFTTL